MNVHQIERGRRPPVSGATVKGPQPFDPFPEMTWVVDPGDFEVTQVGLALENGYVQLCVVPDNCELFTFPLTTEAAELLAGRLVATIKQAKEVAR